MKCKHTKKLLLLLICKVLSTHQNWGYYHDIIIIILSSSTHKNNNKNQVILCSKTWNGWLLKLNLTKEFQLHFLLIFCLPHYPKVTNIQNGMAGNLFFMFCLSHYWASLTSNNPPPPPPPQFLYIYFFKPIKPSTVITFTHSFIPLCILLLLYLFVQCYTWYTDSNGNENYAGAQNRPQTECWTVSFTKDWWMG